MLISTVHVKLGRSPAWRDRSPNKRSTTDAPAPCGDTTLAHPNSFVWYELMTTDADAAETFYSDVVGWRTQDAGMPGMRYTILSVGESGVGGIMTIPPNACAAGSRPGWIGYVGVDDVDAAAGRVKQAGGAIHKPAEDIPGVGRFAVVADPQGASFVLFRGASEQPPERPGAKHPRGAQLERAARGRVAIRLCFL